MRYAVRRTRSPLRRLSVGLVVADNTALAAGETVVQTLLTGAGHLVTAYDDSAAFTPGHDVYVITDPCGAVALGSKYVGVANVVCLKTGYWDDLNLVTTGTNASNTPGSGTTLDLAAHEITAGAPTPATAFSTSTARWGVDVSTLGAGATVFASHPTTSTHKVGFAYDNGTALANGVGNAGVRYVALGFIDATCQNLAVDGQRLLLLSVSWAAKGTVAVARNLDGTATAASGATGAMGVDKAFTSHADAASGATGDLSTAPPYPVLIDGVEPETHVRMGVIQDSNGSLYRVTESLLAQNNQPRMMKSADAGLTWSEQDASNRPGTSSGSVCDLESGYMTWDSASKILTFVWEKSDSARFSSYRTSDHATTPDTWVSNVNENATGTLTASAPQYASVTTPTDQSYDWLFFGTSTKPQYRSRTNSSTYGTIADLDSSGTYPAAILGVNGTDSYVVYEKSSQVHYKKLTSGGTLDASSTRVDSGGTADASGYDVPFTCPVSYTSGGDQIISVLFCNASEQLRVVDIVAGTPGSEQTVGGSNQTPAADEGGTTSQQAIIALAVHGTTLHAVWSEASTWDVKHSERPYGGSWSTPDTLYNTGVGEEIAWVTAAVVTHGGIDYLGYTYDLAPHADDDSNVYYSRFALTTGVARDLTGISSAASDLDGDFIRDRGLNSHADAASAATGSAAVDRPITGNVTSASEFTGSLSVARPITSHADAASGVTGAMGINKALTSHADAASDLDGSAAVDRPLSSHADAASGVTGAMGVNKALTSHADTASGATGSLSVARPLAGISPAASGATADVQRAVGVSAHADAASGVTADLTVGQDLPGQRSLAGIGSASSGATGTLLVTRAIDAKVLAATSGQAATAVLRGLAGTLPAATDFDAAFARMAPLTGVAPAAGGLIANLTSTADIVVDITVTVGPPRVGSIEVDAPRNGSVVTAGPRVGSVTVKEPRMGSVDIGDTRTERGP